MDITEVIEKKEKLEKDIFGLLTDFHGEAGLLPRSINLHIGTITTLGSNPHRNILQNVKVDIRI